MRSIYRQLTLRTRIIISFVLLMVAVMGFIVAAEQLDYDELRAYVISKSLHSEMHRLEAEMANGTLPTLPDGSQFAISVFVKASNAPRSERERVIAEIARTVRDFYLLQPTAARK